MTRTLSLGPIPSRMPRTIILHYHLFKNAGTSVDLLLNKNFPKQWVTKEFPERGGNNSALLEDWIRRTPHARAYSTHTALGPAPRVDDVQIISVLFLRNPVERIRSAYHFERTQEADTWGAKLAKTEDLEGYIKARIARPRDRQCQNFQTERLASMSPGPEPELVRATRALESLSVVGVVEHFEASLQRLGAAITPHFPAFSVDVVHANSSKSGNKAGIGPELMQLLRDENADDFALWNKAKKAFLPAD